MTDSFTIAPIGHVRTAYLDRSSTPVQSALNPDDRGTVELLEPFRDGMRELDGFDFVWLLTWLAPSPDDPVPVRMQQVPFLLSTDPRPIGIFAMRGPRRPNPIGLHLVRLVRITTAGFEFTGVDMVDGTPLLDVKPWAAPLDVPPGASTDGVRSGWFDSVDLRHPSDAVPTPESLRSARGLSTDARRQ